jgi:hypothetical protein
LIKAHNRNAMEAYTNHLSNGSTGSGEGSKIGYASTLRKVGTETS